MMKRSSLFMGLLLGSSLAFADTPDCSVNGVQDQLDNGTQPVDIYTACQSTTALIGRTYQGGLIAYLNTSDGSGIIAAPGDSQFHTQGWRTTTFAFWQNMSISYKSTGATGTAIGTGGQNTAKIVQALGAPNGQPHWPYSYAAYASQMPLNGYSDWVLPSTAEMTVVMNNIITYNGCMNTIRNGTGYGRYWTSTEVNFNVANITNCDGSTGNQIKNNENTVRLIRYFKPLPTMETNLVFNTLQGVMLGGTMTNDRGLSIADKGIVYGTQPDPTLINSHVSAGKGSSDFTVELTQLTAGTTYYARAYAQVGNDVSYGNTRTFVYDNPVSTTAAINVAQTAATLGGNIASTITGTITARGVVYDTTRNPDLSDTVANMGSGTGTFQGSVTNLQAGQTYYARAFATSNKQTVYGHETSFTTLPTTPPSDNCPTGTGLHWRVLQNSYGAHNWFVGELGLYETVDGPNVVASTNGTPSAARNSNIAYRAFDNGWEPQNNWGAYYIGNCCTPVPVGTDWLQWSFNDRPRQITKIKINQYPGTNVWNYSSLKVQSSCDGQSWTDRWTASLTGGTEESVMPSTPPASAIPTVSNVSTASAPGIPSENKIACMTGANSPTPDGRSSTCPVISYGGINFWPLDHDDNRTAINVAGYDSNNNLVSQDILSGVRYVWKITVDATNQTVTFYGQSNSQATLPWSQLIQ